MGASAGREGEPMSQGQGGMQPAASARGSSCCSASVKAAVQQGCSGAPFPELCSGLQKLVKNQEQWCQKVG